VLTTIPIPTDADSAWSGPAAGPGRYATSPNIFSTDVLLWFPWIPTLPQISSLTLPELQQVCSDRDLIPVDAIVSASKTVLQEELWKWTVQQQERLKRQRRARNQLGQLQSVSDPTVIPTAVEPSNRASKSNKMEPGQTSTTERAAAAAAFPNSLAEWSRTVDLEPLLQRREAIRQQKDGTPRSRQSNGPKVLPADTRSDRLSILYGRAKAADVQGNVTLAKELLIKLLDENPDDGRIYRRLARLEKDQGNVAAATKVLQEGLRKHPRNAFLWHGLGQVASSDRERKRCYRRAIQLEPTFAFPYHALGTLEHTQGRVANAMKILKKGVYHCPTNHRLHHALGDLYRDAKVLDMAELCYRKALRYGPAVSRGFCYNALAYVAYEQGDIDKCRAWLRKSVGLNNGRNANGWLSLAQLEESEANTEGARSVCMAGVSLYEKGLLARYSGLNLNSFDAARLACSSDSQTVKSSLVDRVPTYRSGDRFHNVYRNWARLEERYGTRESTEEVYRRARLAFPGDWRIVADLAQYYVKLHLYESARETFAQACAKAGTRHAAPHRLYAAFEMSLGNHKAARKILYRGASTLTQADDGAIGCRHGLAELYYVWAVCEWHLDELIRVEVLLEHALRLTRFGEEGGLRSMILYTLAQLHHDRGDDFLAQHCIGLCLVENLMPGGNSAIWELWSKVASSLGNAQLATECQANVATTRAHEASNGAAGLSRLLSLQSLTASASGLSRMKGVEMERHMRRDPWHHKIFGTEEQQQSFYLGVTLPV
jgi:tetratricopeptide (TPR) repeat protein